MTALEKAIRAKAGKPKPREVLRCEHCGSPMRPPRGACEVRRAVCTGCGQAALLDELPATRGE